jgi:hypothetical protein
LCVKIPSKSNGFEKKNNREGAEGEKVCKRAGAEMETTLSMAYSCLTTLYIAPGSDPVNRSPPLQPLRLNSASTHTPGPGFRYKNPCNQWGFFRLAKGRRIGYI